jgi:hypothetical protein
MDHVIHDDLDCVPLSEGAADRLARIGRLVEILFRTGSLPTVPPTSLTGPVDESMDGPADGDGFLPVPPVLTCPCYEAARDLGIELQPGVVVTDVLGAALQFRYPRTEDGTVRLGMARLTLDLIRATFASLKEPTPIVLTLDEAAALMRIAPSTLKRWVSIGRVRKSVKSRKPIRFWRDTFMQEAMADT